MYTRNVSPYDGGVFHQVRIQGLEEHWEVFRL